LTLIEPEHDVILTSEIAVLIDMQNVNLSFDEGVTNKTCSMTGFRLCLTTHQRKSQVLWPCFSQLLYTYLKGR